MIVLIDILAAATGLTGLWLIGDRKKSGFLWGIVSDVLWITVGVLAFLPGLIVCCVILLFVNTRNYRKWLKDEKEHKD